MIINLKSSKIEKDGEIKFDFPILQLDGSIAKTVQVNMVYVKKSPGVTMDYGGWMVSSNIVDKTSNNPDQQIFFFVISKSKNGSYFKPAHPVSYKISCYDMSSVKFYISSVEEQAVTISNIHLQLEISNAWY